MINEPMKVHGAMKATLVRGNGDVEVTKKDNLIVSVGFDFICDAMARGTGRPGPMSHIAIGTGSTGAPALANTRLEAEIVRQAATYDHSTGTYVFTMTTTFAPGVGDGAIVEAGVFNASGVNSGTMLDRVTFAEINKGSADSLTVQFSFTLS